jgi:hypothetical protein
MLVRNNTDHICGSAGPVYLRPVYHSVKNGIFLIAVDSASGETLKLSRMTPAAYRLFLFSLVTREDVAIPGFQTRRWKEINFLGDFPREDESTFDVACDFWGLRSQYHISPKSLYVAVMLHIWSREDTSVFGLHEMLNLIRRHALVNL